MDYLINLDTQLFLFLNGMHCDFFDTFMKMFSGRFIWIPMYAVLLLIVAKTFTLRQTIAICIGVALVITIADQGCATFIRPYFERLRPSNPDNPISELTHIVGGYRGGSYGFPSCHAANTFALATFMSLLFQSVRFRKAIFLWAGVTIYSRIYLGVHYPGDLLVGAAIGSVIGVAVYLLLCAVAFSESRPVYSPRDARTVIYAMPASPFGGLITLGKINFRYTDLFATALAATTIFIAVSSL